MLSTAVEVAVSSRQVALRFERRISAADLLGATTAPCYVGHMVQPSTRSAIAALIAERDWEQFHTPENLAKSVVIEAGELMECFQWSADADPARVRDELADVLTYCLLLADKIGVDPDQIVLEKLALTREKYPVDKARSRSAKYDVL